MTSKLAFEQEPKDLGGMTQLAVLRLMRALFPEASLLKLDFQRLHPELHSAIAAQLLSVYDADLSTTELLLSFDIDSRRCNLHIEFVQSEKERIATSFDDDALLELWQKFSGKLRELILSAGPEYTPVQLEQNSTSDFSWDLQFYYDPRTTDTSVLDSAGIRFREYVELAIVAGVASELLKTIGGAAEEHAAALAKENIREGELTIVAQEALGVPECKIAFEVGPNSMSSTRNPVRIRVMVYGIHDKTFTPAQYTELITGLKQYFSGVIGAEFILAPFSTGIVFKKTHTRGENKGKISGGLIDLMFVCGESVESVGNSERVG